MADQATRLKKIADHIQITYEQLRRAAANISTLLQTGRATCDAVKAYNLWAIAIWNTQRGMLASARAAGESNVPPDPPQPTLFAFKGVPGAQAFQIDCSGQPTGLKGLMDAAMKKPTGATRFLSVNEVEISTNDPFVMNPEASPSVAQLLQLQEQRKQEKQLGAVPVLVIIIGIAAVSISIAIAAIMKYLETSSVQESESEQVALQAQAFANYTAALAACFQRCTDESCIETCSESVEKPDITLPGQGKWSTLQWVGFVVVAGVGAMIAHRVWTQHQAGKPIFELPEAVDPG